MDTPTFKIAVLPGDGIGPEIIPPCLNVLALATERVGGFVLEYDILPAGAGCYRDSGVSFPPGSREKAKAADAILLAAMGLPDVRYPDGTEISPQLELRFELGLYAGVRPVRSVPGVSGPLADPRGGQLDFVIVRESIEGLFASHGKGVIEDDLEARETLVITRSVSERLFDFSCKLAQRRKQQGRGGKLTCVDKANVFQAFAFFRKIFDERAALFPDVETDHAYIDATALNMARNPWKFDIMVTENMFGDILSDLGAALIGGMGMAPSADIGDDHAVFQPCHGSAPDIAGQGKANPVAMFLSGAMMLDWLGETNDNDSCCKAANLITRAVDAAFSGGDLVPCELGGTAGLKEVSDAVMNALGQMGPV
jgi:3-isopropylmalate dehydrogenase